jgi:hypothetical protein
LESRRPFRFCSVFNCPFCPPQIIDFAASHKLSEFRRRQSNDSTSEGHCGMLSQHTTSLIVTTHVCLSNCPRRSKFRFKLCSLRCMRTTGVIVSRVLIAAVREVTALLQITWGEREGGTRWSKNEQETYEKIKKKKKRNERRRKRSFQMGILEYVRRLL